MAVKKAGTKKNYLWAGLATVPVFLLGIILIFNLASAQPVTENIGISIEIPGEAPPGGGGGPTGPGDVILAGRAYPRALMTIQQNGAVVSTFLAELSGLFTNRITGIQPGLYTFSIHAEDNDQRTSPTLSLSISIASKSVTTISNLFMPPTIGAPTEIKIGESLVVEGQSFPNANIFIYLEPGGKLFETRTSTDGDWFFTLDTSGLSFGDYFLKAKAQFL